MIIVCMRYSRNREEAEEIMQEGFYRVFKYIFQFKNIGSFEGWIRKIMVNAAVQRYRPKSDLHPVIQIDAADTLMADNSDIHSDLNVKELLQLVQALPTAYRMVFNLYVFEGFKHREIAAMIGISEGTSKSNLSDARAILQKALRAKKKMIIS
jgi:RNA polymerase sigma-70 factor (ECF subfamily)